MLARFAVFCLVAVCGFTAATAFSVDAGSSAEASPAANAASHARTLVVQVVDGDTLVVRLPSGKRERVRVLGIDAPEMQPRERCAVQATATARRLAQGKMVALTPDRTQGARDSFKRLLAYVTLPGGADLGKRMVATGYARVYVFAGRPFLRTASYRAAERGAKAGRYGIWGDCSTGVIPAPRPAPPVNPTTSTATTTPTTTTTTTIVPVIPTTPTIPPPTTTAATTAAPPSSSACHSSYPDFCVLPPPPDLDCRDFSQKNFRVLHNVANPDPHGLDGNKDGRGCEI
jgi:micrococcal nuclease